VKCRVHLVCLPLKKNPCPESASELYRPSDHCLSALVGRLVIDGTAKVRFPEIKYLFLFSKTKSTKDLLQYVTKDCVYLDKGAEAWSWSPADYYLWNFIPSIHLPYCAPVFAFFSLQILKNRWDPFLAYFNYFQRCFSISNTKRRSILPYLSYVNIARHPIHAGTVLCSRIRVPFLCVAFITTRAPSVGSTQKLE
jgi:hypothetical protein